RFGDGCRGAGRRNPRKAGRARVCPCRRARRLPLTRPRPARRAWTDTPARHGHRAPPPACASDGKSRPGRMTETASVAGDERLRLFLALRLPGGVLDEIERWQREQLRNVRVVPREHLHVTLAFLGHRPSGELDSIVGALPESAVGAGEIHLTPVRYRETRSVGMLVLDDRGGNAALLARALPERLQRLRGHEAQGPPRVPHLALSP